MTKRTDFTEVRVIVKMVYPVLIKVRAYTRFRLGRIEKVRSPCSKFPVCDGRGERSIFLCGASPVITARFATTWNVIFSQLLDA